MFNFIEANFVIHKIRWVSFNSNIYRSNLSESLSGASISGPRIQSSSARQPRIFVFNESIDKINFYLFLLACLIDNKSLASFPEFNLFPLFLYFEEALLGSNITHPILIITAIRQCCCFFLVSTTAKYWEEKMPTNCKNKNWITWVIKLISPFSNGRKKRDV